jgi:hypothetical protein
MPKALRDFLGLSFFFWSNERNCLFSFARKDAKN